MKPEVLVLVHLGRYVCPERFRLCGECEVLSLLDTLYFRYDGVEGRSCCISRMCFDMPVLHVPMPLCRVAWVRPCSGHCGVCCLVVFGRWAVAWRVVLVVWWKVW